MKMKKYITVLMIAGLITSACGNSGSTSNQESNGQQQESSGELSWFMDDFEAASAEAESSGKPLLIDMYADWCGPCVTLGEQYFTSDEMYPILSRFVLLRLDVDNPSVASYARRYNVSAIPCVVIAKADGTEIDRIVGTTRTIGAYVSALEAIYEQI